MNDYRLIKKKKKEVTHLLHQFFEGGLGADITNKLNKFEIL